MPTWIRNLLAGLWIAAVIGLALAIGFVPLPYYGIGPGPARAVQPLISVEGARTYPSTGRFVMTTIEYRPLSASGVLLAWLDPNEAVVGRDTLFPPGLTAEEEERLAVSEMDTSKIDATSVVLAELAGYPKEHGRGALIRQVVPGCSADGRLFPGDLVSEIDGEPVADLKGAERVIDASGSGRTLTFAVRPLGEDVSEQIDLVRRPCGGSREPLVGISMINDFPIDVAIRSGDVGGPSAGLMFALGLYDLLTPGDLSEGRTIAGTGTIAPDGTVGPIGGIEEKVVAAERAGAEVLLVPSEDFRAAQTVVPEGLDLVEVASFEDAVAALEGQQGEQPGAEAA